MKNVVLLSGGLDSAVCLALAARSNAGAVALSFDYGQRHREQEFERAHALAVRFSVPRYIITLPDVFGASLLTGGAGVVVPARNTVFIAVGISYALAHGFSSVWMGCNASDRDAFPDCRREYFAAWRELAPLADDREVEVVTPLINMTKGEILRTAEYNGIDLSETWSCYTPNNGAPCGECMACQQLERGKNEFLDQ